MYDVSYHTSEIISREGASLAVQGLRLHTPCAGGPLRALVRDPTDAAKISRAITRIKDPWCCN